MKKYIIPIVISLFLASPVAYAIGGLLGPGNGGNLTPGLWIPNSASNTIAPNPSTLQVPCANIVGGCSSSSTPGGSSNTVQFNNSGTLGGATGFTYNTSTGQIGVSAQTSDSYGGSQSTGGKLNLNGTNATTSVLVIYDNQTGQIAGQMVQATCDTGFNTFDCFFIRGLATGTTALGVQGYSVGKGVIKITHFKPTDGSSDANGSGLSIDVNGTNTAAMGIFVTDSIGWTTGRLLTLRNGTNTPEFNVDAYGNIENGDETANARLELKRSTNASNTVTDYLDITSSTATSSAVAGDIIRISTSSLGTSLPISVRGTATTTITGDGSASTILNLNKVLYVPSDFATNGCAGSVSNNTLDTCVNALYSSVSSTASSAVPQGVTIWITNSVPTSSWTNSINFNINGLVPSLKCTPGVTLKYGGAANATSAVIFNYGNPTNHIVSDDSGCTYMGQNTLIAAAQTNTATTTGIFFGGTVTNVGAGSGATSSNAGSPGLNFHDNNVNGFGTDIEIGANAYMLNIQNNSIGGGNGGRAGRGSLIHINVANNSGERNVFTGNNLIDPGNSSATNAIYISDGGTASNFFSFNSIDDAMTYVGSSDGQTVFSNNHFENAAYNTYGPYNLIYATSSVATQVTFIGNEIANDSNNATNTFNTLIKHGVNLYAFGNHLNNYNGATVATFSDHSLNNGSESELICGTAIQGGALTTLISNQTYSAAVGASCVSSQANSWPFIAYIDSSNIVHIKNGGGDQMTIGSTGAITFSNNNTAGGPYAFFGNITATGTISTSGNIKTFNSFVNPPTVGAVTSTLSGSSATSQVFTGSVTATSNMPLISATLGQILIYKNRGTANLNISPSSTIPDFIWQSAVNASSASYQLTPGSSTAFQNDGTYWDQLWR